jgi:hypothetical protein
VTNTANKTGAQQTAETDSETCAAPRGVLTWRSSAERNKLLDLWRLAVFAMFAEQSRCIRLAWVLATLFNAKTGYAFASNGWLAKNTLLRENKLRESLAALEAAGAILRGWRTQTNGQKQRVIYPATDILPPAPRWGRGGAPASGAPESEKKSTAPEERT